MHRTSYWRTIIAAGIGALGAAAAAWLGDLRLDNVSFLIVVAPLYIILIGCLLIALGGVVCLWRDSREHAGRPDLYAALIYRPLRPGLIARLGLRWAFGGHLRPGDAVRVRPYSEIAETLDATGNLEGLPFMEEMKASCGKPFEVYRYIDKINDMRNKTGLRRMRNTVTLTGQRCSGSFHDHCQAGCQILWKEAWLTRVDAAGPLHIIGETVCSDTASTETKITAVVSDRSYTCQMTCLWEASQPMSPVDFLQDLRPLLSGNIGVRAFLLAQLTRLFNGVQRLRGGVGYPVMPCSSNSLSTPSADLRLNPGELVVVRRKADVAQTLVNHRNRGLWFDRDLIRYCGQPAVVSQRVDRVIHESTGKMTVMKTPCIVLRETIATGEFLRCCSQHEHIFWREIWLARQIGHTI